MKRGDILRVRIDHLAPDGAGCAVANDRELHIKGALPGDEVDVRVLAMKRHSARVKLESFVSCGTERIPAECPHFHECGGCKWQDVPYDIQRRMKGELVRSALHSIPGIEPVGQVDVVSSPDTFFYRNKMEFSFDSPPRLEGRVFLGLHEAGRYDRVFDLERCLLQSDVSNRIVEFTRVFIREHGLTAYGLKSHRGLLRFLMVRDGKNTGEVMVNLVTSGEMFPDASDYADRLVAGIPEVTTVVRSIHRGIGNITAGEEREVLYGDGCIREHIGNSTFTISPDSFFQTNPAQTKNLYDTVLEFCRLSGTEHLLDLYCGTGTIGIYCADGAARVTGVELVEDAVGDARRNAAINSVDNIEFLFGKVEETIDESLGSFDVVVCDPPRAGIHPKALDQLLRMRIPRMVYISCNVKAMPHDLELLAMAGYRLRDVRVFDMSPHTPHIETVLLLEIC